MSDKEKAIVPKVPASAEVSTLRRSRRPSSSNLKNIGSNNSQQNKGYHLDKVKAMEKKAEACLREQISYEMKPGKNFVAEFSTTAYEVAKQFVKEFLETDKAVQSEFCVKTETSTEQSGAEVEIRYKLFQKRKDGEPGCYSKLTINFYNTSSRMLANGSRVDLVMDRIFKELLIEVKRQYSNIVVMDRNIIDAISMSLEDQTNDNPVIKPQMNDSLQRCAQNQKEQPSLTDIEFNSSDKKRDPSESQQSHQTMEAEDFAECPICEEGAMLDTIQCEECTMWFHYKCVGLSKERARNIPDSNPFICVNCNDQKLYEDLPIKPNNSVQSQLSPNTNKRSIREKDNEKQEDREIIVIDDRRTPNITKHNSSNENIEQFKGQGTIKNQEPDVRQLNAGKNNKKNSNSTNQSKRKTNSEGCDIESKTLIIQLERQIKEKDKTINLLKRLNETMGNDNTNTDTQTQANNGDQSQPCTNCQSGQKSMNKVDQNAPVLQPADNFGIENRIRLLEMNTMQNLAIMTNNNIQIQTQMQMLSNQMVAQSQNFMFLQQQQVLASNSMNNPYRYIQQPVINGFSQGFNWAQPQLFVRPMYQPMQPHQGYYTQNAQVIQGHVYRPAAYSAPYSATQTQQTTQIANIIGPTLHIDWVIGIWLRSHVHDWANVGVVVHSRAIFADVGPILANDLLLQRIMKVIFFHRNKSGPIFISHCNKRCTYTQQAHNVRCWDSIGISFFFFFSSFFLFSFLSI